MSTDAEEFLGEFDTEYELVKEVVKEGVSLDMNRNVHPISWFGQPLKTSLSTGGVLFKEILVTWNPF